MTQPPYGSEDAFRSRLDAVRLWSNGALGTWEALARAARRSREEARAVRESSRSTPDGAYLARRRPRAGAVVLVGVDHARGGERLGRAYQQGDGTSHGLLPPVWSPRAALLGTLASDLYLGYAALRERGGGSLTWCVTRTGGSRTGAGRDACSTRRRRSGEP